MSLKDSTSVQQTDRLTGGQQGLLGQLVGQVGGQLGQGIQGYGQPIVGGPSQLQQQGFGSLGDLGNILPQAGNAWMQGFSQYNPQQQFDYLRQAEPALARSLSPFDPAGTQQRWQQTVLEPGRQNWQDLQRGIMEKYAGKNAGSSGAVWRELGRAGEQFATNQNAQLGSMMWQAEQAQNARNAQGIGQSMQMAQAPTQLMQGIGQVGQQGQNLINQILQAGGTQRGITNQQLGSDYNQWQRQQAYNNPWLRQMQGALGTQAYGEPIVTRNKGLGSTLGDLTGSYLGSASGSGMVTDMLGGMFGD